MLQQILRDMWVDPEILAELDEGQKQTLFTKMREEQVRRWQAWDQKLSKEDGDRTKMQRKGNKKQVQFLKGDDGEPWVWVMGEHSSDKSIDSILSEEERRTALSQAREEAHQLRKSVEKELTHLMDYKPMDSLEQTFDLSLKSVDSLEDAFDMYCSVEGLRQRIEDLEPEVKMNNENLTSDNGYRNDNMQMELNKNKMNFNFIEGKRDILQELGLPADGECVSRLVVSWERKVAAARASDILRGLRARRSWNQREDSYSEHDEKSNNADDTMGDVVISRHGSRRSNDTPILPSTMASQYPKSKADIVEWFKTVETKKGTVMENYKVANWFHGLISRTEAESVLIDEKPGSFLIRLSERVLGYALSYRCNDRCKHYLVETDGGYRLHGAGHITHRNLVDLINHHKKVAITDSGAEILKSACLPVKTPAIFTTPS